MEIEKKFLLRELPERLYEYPCESIEQGYIIVSEYEELRIRRKGQSLVFTFKRGRGTTRNEIEIDISAEQYDEFKQCVIGTPIHKKRINLPYEEHTIEIDVYKDSLEGLVVAEVEFVSTQSMDQFSPPPWFGKDISSEAEFKNKNLALDGFPASLLRSWKESSRPPWHFRQSGVVPFRRTETGYEVLLITTRKTGRWIVPKGIIEPDLSPADSAEQEALEEAGIAGTVVPGICETYSFDKWNGRCAVALFPFEVTVQHEHWAEEESRKRSWFPRKDLDNRLEYDGLREAVFRILDHLSAREG